MRIYHNFFFNLLYYMDQQLIRNPFMCSIDGVSNRFFCDKQARNTRGNTEYAKTMRLNDQDVMIYNELDPKLNYIISTNKNRVDTELVGIDAVDYSVPPNILNLSSKYKHTDGLPLSFVQIDNVEDGIVWYRTHYPRIPDDMIPIIARYHWGPKINKHTMKKEKKRLRKHQRKQAHLNIVHPRPSERMNPLVVRWD